MDKLTVHQFVEEKIQERIDALQLALNDAMEATSDDSKSTAGDKHETSRAMAHLEQEKLGIQFSEALKLKEMIHRIDPSHSSEKIGMGSLVETSIGWLYLSVGIGQLEINGIKLFCLTPIAPLGQALLGKKAGEQIDWQGKGIQIVSVQ